MKGEKAGQRDLTASDDEWQHMPVQKVGAELGARGGRGAPSCAACCLLPQLLHAPPEEKELSPFIMMPQKWWLELKVVLYSW